MTGPPLQPAIIHWPRHFDNHRGGGLIRFPSRCPAGWHCVRCEAGCDSIHAVGSPEVKLFLLATMSVLVLLAACQSKTEDDPPAMKPYECPQHTLDTGMCGK